MGMGIGAAMTGLRPIIEGMNMGFLLLAYNQISNNAGMLHYTSGGQYKAILPPFPPLDPFGCHSRLKWVEKFKRWMSVSFHVGHKIPEV